MWLSGFLTHSSPEAAGGKGRHADISIKWQSRPDGRDDCKTIKDRKHYSLGRDKRSLEKENWCRYHDDSETLRKRVTGSTENMGTSCIWNSARDSKKLHGWNQSRGTRTAFKSTFGIILYSRNAYYFYFQIIKSKKLINSSWLVKVHEKFSSSERSTL